MPNCDAMRLALLLLNHASVRGTTEHDSGAHKSDVKMVRTCSATSEEASRGDTLDPLSSRASVRPPVLYTDPDQFGGVLPGVRRRHLLITRESTFLQWVLQIGDIRLAVVKRPPCASEASLTQGRFGIALPMSESPGLKLNGLRADRPLLFTHGLTIPHRIFQPSELTIGAVFHSGRSARQFKPPGSITFNQWLSNACDRSYGTFLIWRRTIRSYSRGMMRSSACRKACLAQSIMRL